MKNTIKELPADYHHLTPQINTELLRASLIGYDRKIPEFVGFSQNSNLVNEFINSKEKGYRIEGVRVHDKISDKQLDFTIYVFGGLIGGYSITGNKNYDINVEQIDVSSFRKTVIDNPDFNKLCNFLTPEEIALIDAGEVYEVNLKGKLYYHLCDLEDGDFIGIDIDKVLYKITHDPFEIRVLDIDLKHMLN